MQLPAEENFESWPPGRLGPLLAARALQGFLRHGASTGEGAGVAGRPPSRDSTGSATRTGSCS
eukprot:5655262-Alexandrium_andersonii.AAC.1